MKKTSGLTGTSVFYPSGACCVLLMCVQTTCCQRVLCVVVLRVESGEFATTQVCHVTPACVGPPMLTTVTINDSLSHGQSKQHYTHISTIHSGYAWMGVHLRMGCLCVCVKDNKGEREKGVGGVLETRIRCWCDIKKHEAFSDIWWMCNPVWL